MFWLPMTVNWKKVWHVLGKVPIAAVPAVTFTIIGAIQEGWKWELLLTFVFSWIMTVLVVRFLLILLQLGFLLWPRKQEVDSPTS